MRLILRTLTILGALALPVLAGSSAAAYQGSSGASVTTCASRVAPGGSTCVTATFTTTGNPNVGNSVTYTSNRGGGSSCTVTFNPPAGTTDRNGQSQTTATFGTGCNGSVQVCATDANTGQSACASVIVNNGKGHGGGGQSGGGGSGSNGNGQTQVGSKQAAAVVGGSAAGLLVIAALVAGALLRRRRGAPAPRP
jgi:hypothetical protein